MLVAELHEEPPRPESLRCLANHRDGARELVTQIGDEDDDRRRHGLASGFDFGCARRARRAPPGRDGSTGSARRGSAASAVPRARRPSRGSPARARRGRRPRSPPGAGSDRVVPALERRRAERARSAPAVTRRIIAEAAPRSMSPPSGSTRWRNARGHSPSEERLAAGATPSRMASAMSTGPARGRSPCS